MCPWVVCVDQAAMAEYRYRAVREVLAGSPMGEVAVRYGTSRQSLHTWRERFQREGFRVWRIGRAGVSGGLEQRLLKARRTV